MTDSWKAQENQTQVSLALPMVLGNRSAIPTFPPPHDRIHPHRNNQRKEAYGISLRSIPSGSSFNEKMLCFC
jgi:hypothetical protein